MQGASRAGSGPSRRTLLSTASALAVLGLVSGCLSPTLPLPPPSRPELTPPDALGMTTITGRVPGGTTAFAESLATGRIAGQTTDGTGRYSLVLEATAGDLIVVYYRDGLDTSDFVEVEVPETVPDLSGGGMAGSSGN